VYLIYNQMVFPEIPAKNVKKRPTVAAGVAKAARKTMENHTREGLGMGAPKQNKNAMRHGLTATGKLPLSCMYVGRHIGKFRRDLEQAVMIARGRVTVSDAAAITCACRWERHALLALRWLTEEYEKLSVDDRLKFSGESSRATSARDNAIARLGLADELNPLGGYDDPAEADGGDGGDGADDGNGGNAAGRSGFVKGDENETDVMEGHPAMKRT